MHRKRRAVPLLMLLFAGLFALRLIHLGADPPPDLSRSMGYMSDPGGYAHNARNKVVFGRWETDMWNLMYISPLPHACTYAVFLAAGPGVAQMNLVPVAFSCLLLVVAWRLFKIEYDGTFAAVGLLLLAVNYQFLMFSRIAVRVMPLLFFSLLALWFLDRKTSSARHYVGAGALAFVAFTVKGTFMQILPAILLGTALFLFFQNRGRLKPVAVGLAWFALGAAAVFSVWLAACFLPHKAMFTAYAGENIAWLTPRNFSEALTRFWQRPLFFFHEMPVVACLSGLAVLVVLFRSCRTPRKISLLEWVCSLWVVSNLMYYAVISYHAARHFVALVFPLVVLSTSLLKDIHGTSVLRRPDRHPWLFYPLLTVWAFFPVSAALIMLRGRPAADHWADIRQALLQTSGLSLGLTLAVFLAVQLWPKRKALPLPMALRLSAVGALILASLFLNLRPYSDWALHPRFHIRDISRDLGRLRRHMVIGGLLAPMICLENGHGAHPYRRGYINPYPDFMERFGITHVLPTLHAGEVEKKEYLNNFPDAMSKARLLARYPLWTTFAELYELDPSLTGPDERNVFEGETFFGMGGIPRFDREASRSLAFLLAAREGNGRMLLPVGEYTPGDYRAVFRLKIPSGSRPNGAVARLDILSRKGSRLIASREIDAGDFSSLGAYGEFGVPFRLNGRRPLILRILTNGAADLWVDRAALLNVTPRPLADRSTPQGE